MASVSNRTFLVDGSDNYGAIQYVAVATYDFWALNFEAYLISVNSWPCVASSYHTGQQSFTV